MIRDADLPARLTWGLGKAIEVLGFHDGGVVLTEVNSIGDRVTFVPYYEYLLEDSGPSDLTRVSRTFTADAVVAPPRIDSDSAATE